MACTSALASTPRLTAFACSPIHSLCTPKWPASSLSSRSFALPSPRTSRRTCPRFVAPESAQRPRGRRWTLAAAVAHMRRNSRAASVAMILRTYSGVGRRASLLPHTAKQRTPRSSFAQVWGLPASGAGHLEWNAQRTHGKTVSVVCRSSSFNHHNAGAMAQRPLCRCQAVVSPRRLCSSACRTARPSDRSSSHA